MPVPLQNIRNFCIIAHIDHGKSTLADRLLEKTNSVSRREMKEQILDSLEIERERGITIKAQTARMMYKYREMEHALNLIDTPGHVDFTYEVSRSLAACQGALLVVDASQGIEAQTISNTYLALEHGLEILPVINKIDLPASDPDRVLKELNQDLGIDVSMAVKVSAKEGWGIDELLEKIVTCFPPPQGDPAADLQSLVFDAWFDSYQGVIALIRVMNGTLKRGEIGYFLQTKTKYEILKCGYLTPKMIESPSLSAGEVGFVICGIKDIHDVKIGDTLTHLKSKDSTQALPGFKEVKPVVFSGIFPIDPNDYDNLRSALEKLMLNDSSLKFEPENSSALGLGFRLGYLGLLHMEIVQERLEREHNLSLITTAPSVVYEIVRTDHSTYRIENPAQFPELHTIEEIREPMVKVSIYSPSEYLGNVLALCEEKRGKQKKMDFLREARVLVEYELPFSEIILDFHDRLKSSSRGYASMDYEPIGMQASDLVKLDILLNGEPVDALALVVHRDRAYSVGRALCKKLKEVLDRQMFEVAIQAAIGKKVIARETLGAMRKDVTSKCYGGDITRKRKLLEKQKKGKKRMKQVGKVELPQEAFLAVLSIGNEE
jgi:GTP-binding protein LepA